MAFTHEFTVAAPREKVVSFHRKRQSLAAITPPPLIVRIQDGPEILSSGDELRFTLWLGPFPHPLARRDRMREQQWVC